MDSSTLSFLIKDLFKSKGFDLVGFSKIQQMKDFDYMKDWLENGYHADMEYLENPKRQEPAAHFTRRRPRSFTTLFEHKHDELTKGKQLSQCVRVCVCDWGRWWGKMLEDVH